ncbi:DUF481 domain-containing protein [Novosphingobium sp. MBES04]|uniref:DUF481 domain-containing protein n=1 Tax=Novosphingobium sp. MBES04 TaxID=1206458 RepID=UPI00057C8335|nr:DUF481 domain-containing protein [Novosphingobium sp. MBES04]
MPFRFRSSLVLPLVVLSVPAFAQDEPPEGRAVDWDVIAMPDPIPPRPVFVSLPTFVEPIPFVDADRPTLPRNVRAMLEESMKGEEDAEVDAVVKFAIKVQPWFKDEIRGMHKSYRDRRAAEERAKFEAKQRRIRQAGILQLWKGQIDLGGFRNTGNTSNFGVTGGFKADRQGIKWQHTITATANYQETDSTVTTNKYLLAYQPRFTLHEGYFIYGRAQYERDPISGFENRYSLSGGLGRRLIRTDRMTLSVEAGPAMRMIDYVDEPSETQYSALMSVDFAWKLNNTVKLSQVASGYVSTENNTFTSLTALETAMTKNLKLKLSYNFEHETAPAAGTLKTDTISSFSVVYGF